jgi:hypothetical protein
MAGERVAAALVTSVPLHSVLTVVSEPDCCALASEGERTKLTPDVRFGTKSDVSAAGR